MSKRDRKKVHRARHASVKARVNPKPPKAKRRPLSAYPKVGNAYDVSRMMDETGCRLAGRLLVTECLWVSVILPAPNHTEADWRLYDVAHWVKMLCVGDKEVERKTDEWVKRQLSQGIPVFEGKIRMLNNRTTEFWFATDLGVAVGHEKMKLVNLADGNGSHDMMVMLGDEDEMALFAARGLSPDDYLIHIVARTDSTRHAVVPSH